MIQMSQFPCVKWKIKTRTKMHKRKQAFAINSKFQKESVIKQVTEGLTDAKD